MAKGKTFSTFEQWHFKDVRLKLNIHPAEESDPFRAWITSQNSVPDEWMVYLEFLRKRLVEHYGSWNEAELFAQFITPFLTTLAWDSAIYDLFNQRPLSATVGGYHVSGIVDGMVAKGSYEPEKPYFFLQEYKRMKQTEADPLGQLLIAMLAARVLNEDHKPLYGCYVIGSYWRFVLLEGDTYVQSQGYDATDKTEIQIIWGILKQTKNYIEIRVAEDLEAERLL